MQSLGTENTTTTSEMSERQGENPLPERQTRRHIRVPGYIIVIPGDPIRYECTFCNNEQQQRRQQQRRQQQQQTFWYPCKDCGKKLKTKDTLKRHQNIHINDGSPKFNCSICSKAFRTKFWRNTHEKTHKNGRIFLCDICEKRFFGKKDLKRHQLVHSSAKTFVCPKCSKTFNRRDNFKRHMRERHYFTQEMFEKTIAGLPVVETEHFRGESSTGRVAGSVNSSSSTLNTDSINSQVECTEDGIAADHGGESSTGSVADSGNSNSSTLKTDFINSQVECTEDGIAANMDTDESEMNCSSGSQDVGENGNITPNSEVWISGNSMELHESTLTMGSEQYREKIRKSGETSDQEQLTTSTTLCTMDSNKLTGGLLGIQPELHYIHEINNNAVIGIDDTKKLYEPQGTYQARASSMPASEKAVEVQQTQYSELTFHPVINVQPSPASSPDLMIADTTPLAVIGDALNAATYVSEKSDQQSLFPPKHVNFPSISHEDEDGRLDGQEWCGFQIYDY